VFLTEVVVRAKLIVCTTAQRYVPNGVAPRERPGLSMIKLDEILRITPAAACGDIRAAARITLPDYSPDRGRNMP
jgi:hypothetical protein